MKSDPREALEDIFGALKTIFGRYSREARYKAWRAVTSSKGKQEVERLLNSPSVQVRGTAKLLTFKEWIESRARET